MIPEKYSSLCKKEDHMSIITDIDEWELFYNPFRPVSRLSYRDCHFPHEKNLMYGRRCNMINLWLLMPFGLRGYFRGRLQYIETFLANNTKWSDAYKAFSNFEAILCPRIGVSRTLHWGKGYVQPRIPSNYGPEIQHPDTRLISHLVLCGEGEGEMRGALAKQDIFSSGDRYS